MHSDHLATPRLMSDQNQTIVWRWDGDAFGEGGLDNDPDNNGVSVFMPLRFPGQMVEEPSGLYYNYYRDYDPQLGRYIQSDPIGLDGGINTYSFVLNNPVIYFDLKGLHHAKNSNCANLDYNCKANLPPDPEPEPWSTCKTVCTVVTFTCGMGDGPLFVMDFLCSATAYTICETKFCDEEEECDK